MRTLSSITFVALLLVASGCSLSGTEGGSGEIEWVDFSRFSQDTTALVGAWEWRRTTCCFGDLEVSTPSSTGETGTLVFTSSDTVEVYWNGSLERQQTYSEYLDDTQWGVREGAFARSTAYKDGPESIYRRKE